MPMEYREVECRGVNDKFYKGWFHCWCKSNSNAAEFKLSQMFALVEDEDGEVHEVPSRWIRFCDLPKTSIQERSKSKTCFRADGTTYERGE